MAENEKSGFSGILGGLKKMVFTEDYLEENKTEEISKAPSVSADQSQNVATANSYTQSSSTPSSEMVKKIYGLLEGMNKPGVDFFELWNAAEAMGGVNPTNLQNAFTTLKVLGLSKETVISSGESYCSELQGMLNNDIQKKKSEKDALALALNNEKQQLQKAKLDIEEKIKSLSSQLVETTNRLNQVDSKYIPQIQSIEVKIDSGSQALNVVVGEINTVINMFKITIK